MVERRRTPSTVLRSTRNTGTQIHDYTLWQTPDQDTTHRPAVAVGAGSIWVVANDAGKVFRVDPATGSVQATIDVPNAYNIAFGNGAAWTTGSGDMSRIDPATNEVTFTTTLPRVPGPAVDDLQHRRDLDCGHVDGTVFKVDRSGNIAATYNDGRRRSSAPVHGRQGMGRKSGRGNGVGNRRDPRHGADFRGWPSGHEYSRPAMDRCSLVSSSRPMT